MGLRPLQSSPPILFGRTPPRCGYAAVFGCATVPAEAAATVVNAGAAKATAAPTTRAESTGSRRACRSFRIQTSSFGRPDVISAGTGPPRQVFPAPRFGFARRNPNPWTTDIGRAASGAGLGRMRVQRKLERRQQAH